MEFHHSFQAGRWTLVFGETTPIVIPKKELLDLRHAITEFVASDSEA